MKGVLQAAWANPAAIEDDELARHHTGKEPIEGAAPIRSIGHRVEEGDVRADERCQTMKVSMRDG